VKALVTYALVALAVIGAGGEAPARAAALERVSAGIHADYIRLVFHTDSAATFEQLETVDHSVRIVLDGVTAGQQVLQDALPQLDDRYAPVIQIEFEQYTDGLLALVELNGDLADSVETKAFVLTPDRYGGNRIVVDISKGDISKGEGGQADAPADSVTRKSANPFAAPAPDAVGGADPAQRATLGPGTVPTARTPSAPATGKEPDTPVADEAVAPDDRASTAPAPCTAPDRALAASWSYAAAFRLAECYEASGQWQDAETVYLRILQRDPEFQRARLALARAYANLGKVGPAKQAYLHVLATNPPVHVVQEIQARLARLRPPAPAVASSIN